MKISNMGRYLCGVNEGFLIRKFYGLLTITTQTHQTPRMKLAEKPHRTVIFREWKGISWITFSGSQNTYFVVLRIVCSIHIKWASFQIWILILRMIKAECLLIGLVVPSVFSYCILFSFFLGGGHFCSLCSNSNITNFGFIRIIPSSYWNLQVDILV